MGDGRRVTAPCRGCGFHCWRCHHGCWCWWAMGDRRQVAGSGRRVMVVVVAVMVYNNNFSVSNVFVTIMGSKNTYVRARGRNAPEPIIVVVVVAAAVAAAAGSVAGAATSDPWWAVRRWVVL